MKLKIGVYGVLRGGSYYYVSGFLRVTYRFRYLPESRYWDYGFRFVVRGEK